MDNPPSSSSLDTVNSRDGELLPSYPYYNNEEFKSPTPSLWDHHHNQRSSGGDSVSSGSSRSVAAARAQVAASASSSQKGSSSTASTITKTMQTLKKKVTNLFHFHRQPTPENNRPPFHRQPSSFDSYLQYFKQSPKLCCFDAMLCPIAAALLMHGPGLKVKWGFEDWPDYLESLLGATVEGVFLLLFATRIAIVVHYLYGYLAQCRQQTAITKKSTGRVVGLLLVMYIGLALILALWSFMFILSAILGDATFRVMSGNDSPSAEVCS